MASTISTASSSQTYVGSLGRGIFTTTLTLTKDPADYACCSCVRATFYLKLAGKATQAVEVGHIVSYLVGKTTPGETEDSKPLWVVELCRDSKDKCEIPKIMRTLFGKVGICRKSKFLEPFVDQLRECDEFLVIDTFKLGLEYRSGKGIGALALEAYHALVPQLLRQARNGESPSGKKVTVLLAPGMPRSCQNDYPNTDHWAAVKKLRPFYEDNHFELFEDDSVVASDQPDNLAVMGRGLEY